jgi:hypothetical protein
VVCALLRNVGTLSLFRVLMVMRILRRSRASVVRLFPVLALLLCGFAVACLLAVGWIDGLSEKEKNQSEHEGGQGTLLRKQNTLPLHANTCSAAPLLRRTRQYRTSTETRCDTLRALLSLPCTLGGKEVNNKLLCVLTEKRKESLRVCFRFASGGCMFGSKRKLKPSDSFRLPPSYRHRTSIPISFHSYLLLFLSSSFLPSLSFRLGHAAWVHFVEEY